MSTCNLKTYHGVILAISGAASILEMLQAAVEAAVQLGGAARGTLALRELEPFAVTPSGTAAPGCIRSQWTVSATAAAPGTGQPAQEPSAQPPTQYRAAEQFRETTQVCETAAVALRHGPGTPNGVAASGEVSLPHLNGHRVYGSADQVSTNGSRNGSGSAAGELVVPITGSGRVEGEFRLRAWPGTVFTGDTQELMCLLGEQLALLLPKMRRFDQLEQARGEWELIFDGMVDGVYICCTDGLIRRANRALASMLGLPQEEILEHRPEELRARLRDYQVLRPWQGIDGQRIGGQGVETGPADARLQTMEFRSGNLGRVFMETTFELGAGSGAVREDGVVLHRAGIVRDVTEQRLLQEQLLQSEKLAALGELVSGVAHELNNPLTTVVGYAQLLADEPGLAANVQRRINMIHQEAERASHIVQNLLAFAHRSQPQKSLVAIKDVFDSLLQIRGYQLQADNVRVVLELGDDLPAVWGDPVQLQQVFLNIINNAAQAVHEGRGGEVRISAQAVAINGAPGLRVTVADNGPGIAPEHLRRVFDPFFSTKGAGRGTGLGMSISLGIVSSHQGRIWAESVQGQGARFLVELPAAGDVTVTAPVEPAAAPVPRPQSHILVVDDEEPVVTLITEILALDSHCVTPAFNGAEALSLLQGHDFDLIISDVRMPAVGGPTFFEILQTTRPDLLPRVMFVTGDTVSKSTQSFLQQAGRPMLSKPFSPERLRSLVADNLRQRAV